MSQQFHHHKKIVSRPSLYKQIEAEAFISKFKRWSWIVLACAALLQVTFFFSVSNVIGVMEAFFAWFLITNIFLTVSNLRKFPLSSFIIIGFGSTQFYCPLVFTLTEGKPMDFNLVLPYQVFTHALLQLIVLTVCHALYRLLSQEPLVRSRELLGKLGLFTPPKDNQLWIMGIVGLASMYYVYYYSPSVGHDVGGAGDKSIQSLIPFTYAPFFIPIKRMYGSREPSSLSLKIQLIIFTIVLFVVSIGANSRGAFMLGFASVGFSYGLGLLLGLFDSQIVTVKNVIYGLLAFWIFTGPLSDLGTAMVIVRAQRGDVTRDELLALTFEKFTDKEAIELYRKINNGTDRNKEWDESYVNNIFLSRFANLKYNDLSLIQASKIEPNNPQMLSFSIDRFIATLPGPVISAFGIDVDKEKVGGSSFGDYLYYLAGGGTSALGGFRTGSFSGTGMAELGWWYLAGLGLLIIPVYLLFDASMFTVRKGMKNQKNEIRFSLCGLFILFSIFQFVPSESIFTIGAYLLRGWVQQIMLYFFMFHITNIITIVLSRPSARVKNRNINLS